MLCNTIERHFSKKNRSIPQFLTFAVKKNILVPLHKKLINRIRNDIIPFLISTNPRWRPLCEASPPPLRKSRTCHNHHVVETFFSGPWNLEYIPITNFLNRMCLSTQNPTWLPYWLALLAQMPR